MATTNASSVKTVVKEKYGAIAAEEAGPFAEFMGSDPRLGIKDQGWSAGSH